MADSLNFLVAFLNPQVKIRIKLKEEDAATLETLRIRTSAIVEAQDNINVNNKASAVRAIFDDLAKILIEQENETILAATSDPVLKRVVSDNREVYTVEAIHRACRWGNGVTDLEESQDALRNILSVQDPIDGNLTDLLDPTPVNLIALADQIITKGRLADSEKVKLLRNKVFETYLEALESCLNIRMDKYKNP